MKIRNKITLWITGAGLLAGLLFSAIISYELVEQPYALLDADLDSQAHMLFSLLFTGDTHGTVNINKGLLDRLGQHYWLQIDTQSGKTFYLSSLARTVEIVLDRRRERYNTIGKIADRTRGNTKPVFRVRHFQLMHNGQQYGVWIARPMERLHEELVDLAIAIVIGLVGYTIFLLCFGYYAAGQILKPVAKIKSL